MNGLSVISEGTQDAQRETDHPEDDGPRKILDVVNHVSVFLCRLKQWADDEQRDKRGGDKADGKHQPVSK